MNHLKKRLLLVFMAVFLLPMTSLAASPNTLIPPGFGCGSLNSSNNTYSVKLSLPPQYSQPGYEVANGVNGTLYASGYMGTQATAYNLPINTSLKARVTDGHGNYSTWSSNITCYHSTSGYAISFSCGTYNSTTHTFPLSVIWSPNVYVNWTKINDYNGNQVGYHSDPGGISSPDNYYPGVGGGNFYAIIQATNGVNYYETGTCTP